MNERLEEKLFAQADQHKIPLYGILELTPVCNLKCDMCYVRLPLQKVNEMGGMRPLEEWIQVAEQMQKAGTLFVLITGGEPLLYPHFKELYLALRQMGMIISINTNGTLIDEAWVDFFKHHPPRRINITVYGASAKTYDRLCHLADGYERTVRALYLLKDAGIKVKINGSLVKVNVADYTQIVKLGEALDMPVRMDTYMYPVLRERDVMHTLQSRMDPITAAHVRVDVLRQEMGEETFFEYIAHHLEMITQTDITDHTPGRMSCRAGKSSYVINWQMEMLPCVVMNQLAIPVLEVGFEYAWEYMKTQVSMVHTSSVCHSCQYRTYCLHCAASAIAECGDISGTPAYLCAYTKETIRLFELLLQEKSMDNRLQQKEDKR